MFSKEESFEISILLPSIPSRPLHDKVTVVPLSDPRKRRNNQQLIWEDILNNFAKNDNIDFAYPTIRYYQNNKTMPILQKILNQPNH